MTRGTNRRHGSTLDESFARLDTKVEGLERAQETFENELTALSKRMDQGFATLATKLDARSPSASIIISLATFLLSLVIFVGWLAWQPITDEQVQLREEFNRTYGFARDEDRRLNDKFDRIRGEVDRMRGAFDLITRKGN